MAKVTNINYGGVVGIQADTDTEHDEDNDHTEVTNINNGGTVGIQARHVSGNVVITFGSGGRR